MVRFNNLKLGDILSIQSHLFKIVDIYYSQDKVSVNRVTVNYMGSEELSININASTYRDLSSRDQLNHLGNINNSEILQLLYT